MRGKCVSHVTEQVSAMSAGVSTSRENALNPGVTGRNDGILGAKTRK
jgi:hypothetical protein